MSQVEIFFVTNRNHQPNNKKLLFGKEFNQHGVAAIRFGRATISVENKKGHLDKVEVYPEKLTDKGFEAEGSSRFLPDLRSKMEQKKSDALIFIHGFNVDFKESLIAGAKIALNNSSTDKPLDVVVFTWPSDGEAIPYMSYYNDREDAMASGAALARAFLKLKEFIVDLEEKDYCNHSLHLLAHSMGNFVLRHGLQALIAKDSLNLVRVFDQIVLAAPDEDDDAFETDKKLRLLPRIGRQTTVYFNPKDRALVISDKTKANPDRLGSDGPRLVDLIPKKIASVDCRAADMTGDKLTQHSYFLGSEAVSSDLRQILRRIAPEEISGRRYSMMKRAFEIIG